METGQKKRLPNVTLVAMTSVQVKAAIKAMEYSMREIEFGDAVIITHRKPRHLPKNIKYKHIDILDNIDKFNYEAVYNMGDYIETEFALLVHSDGFVVNPDMWRDEFLDYDYIGSPWPEPHKGDGSSYWDIYGNPCRVGNSVSIRSKRLMEFPKKAKIPWEKVDGYYNEDIFICCKNKHLFEEAGMRIAPIEIAKYFGHEKMIPEVQGIRPFIFHKWDGTNMHYPDFRQKKVIRPFLGRIHGKLNEFLKNRHIIKE